MSTLVGAGHSLRRARLIVMTVLRFTVGYVLEEQTALPTRTRLKGFDMAAYAAAHPTVVAGVTEYFQDGHTVDDLFRDCLEQIIHGPAGAARSRRPDGSRPRSGRCRHDPAPPEPLLASCRGPIHVLRCRTSRARRAVLDPATGEHPDHPAPAEPLGTTLLVQKFCWIRIIADHAKSDSVVAWVLTRVSARAA